MVSLKDEVISAQVIATKNQGSNKNKKCADKSQMGMVR